MIDLSNPFPGLRCFLAEEDYLFFGRHEQIEDLLRRLRTNRLVAVVGTSGSGKSSLVRAGLLPAVLGGGMAQAGSAWELAVLRPGGSPMTHLARALCEAGLYDADGEDALFHLQATLSRSRNGLIEAIRQSRVVAGSRLLLVVDQFEELFRFNRASATSQEEAIAFVNLLLHATGQTEQHVYVVLTMRSDFLGECSQFLGLAEAVNDGEFLIPRMTRDQIQEAIEGPIRVRGAAVAPRLLFRLLNDVEDNQDQLPVLQHALMRTWDLWHQRQSNNGVAALDLEHYEATGGMQSALSRHADEVFAALASERHRTAAARIFKALTERGPDGRGIRRPTRLGQLVAIAAVEEAVVKQVIEAYRAPGVTFLMPPASAALEEPTVIDISHESLMRVWHRLWGWVEEEAQSARIYRRLHETTGLHAGKRAGLYHDPDLQIALSWREVSEPNSAWAEQYGGGFDEAMAFLSTSRAAAERGEREREAARQQELERARQLTEAQARLASLFKRFAVGLALGMCLAVALTVWAIAMWQEASLQEQEAILQEADANEQRRVAQLEEQKAKAIGLVQQVLIADTPKVPAIVGKMTGHRHWSDPELRNIYQTAPEKSPQKLHASLALLPVDTGQVDYLFGRLLEADPQDVLPVLRDALAPHKEKLLDKLWVVIEKPARGEEAQRLRAAAALAIYNPDSERWSKVQTAVVDDLLAVSAAHLTAWKDLLRPIRVNLLAPLSVKYRTINRPAERSLATDILADYAADRPQVLADLLMDADNKQFAVISPKFKELGDRGFPILTSAVTKKLLPHDDKGAKRQTNAAVALLRLNQPQKVWPLLKHSPDPRVRTYLIHRLGLLGVEAKAIVKHLDQESDPGVRRALLLSLDEFSEKDFPSKERQAFVPKVKDLYQKAPDPGLHAAAEWLLRTWKEEEWLLKENENWKNNKEQRELRLKNIEQLTKNDKDRTPHWYVNHEGQTLVVIPGPVEFLMGEGAALHWRPIGRSFAVASKEVTVEQFHRFSKSHQVYPQFAPTKDCPVHNVSWYDAAGYCNWLSEKEGIPKEQWCYEPNQAGQYASGMKIAANYLHLTGYRLPTEAEWEYACRAGTATRYAFGESEELLPRYAWFQKNSQNKSWPVGSLKPNDLGLFDLLGNNWEWCQDVYQPYSKAGVGKRTEDREDPAVITDNNFRRLRGGSILDQGAFLRFTYQMNYVPSVRYYHVGFRPARTLAFSSFDRYRAAREAALAAAGQEKEEPRLDKDATSKRRQALDLLKAELLAWSKGRPRLLIVQDLWRWQQESDLAGIREEAALAKLPEEERKAFKLLWADVAKTVEPTSNVERLDFAQLAFDSKQFAVATRLWAEALANNPSLGVELRYHAAQAAILAAAGQGKHEPLLNEAAKAQHRRQGLAWLRVELTGWSKLFDLDPSQFRQTINQTLSHWQKDSDLASIRAPESLAKLQVGEQKEFTQLWAQVAELWKKATDKYVASLQESLSSDRKIFPSNSPKLADDLATLGRLLLEQKRWTEAETVIRECLAIREKVGPNVWNRFNAQAMLGGALLGQKKYAEAEPLLLQGYAGMKAREKFIPLIGKDRLPEAVERLVQLYEATGNTKEAARWRTERRKLEP